MSPIAARLAELRELGASPAKKRLTRVGIAYDI